MKINFITERLRSTQSNINLFEIKKETNKYFRFGNKKSQKYSDCDIIDMRIKKQKLKMSCDEIYGYYKKIYPNITLGYIRQVLNYEIRSSAKTNII